MKTFLEYVAEDILRKYGNDLSHIAVVFPNKRASLFLSEHLARKAGRPIWSPAYITISDFFRQHSQKSVADTIKLVCDLHKSFIHCTGINETLDHFYSWGELLLSDFDDIDKNMADAEKVFANLRNIHELDDISYLNDNQKLMLKRFFGNFSDEHNSQLKERFLQLWSHFYPIYKDFNQRLSQQGIAYEGALYREVVEGELGEMPYHKYLFVGFNFMHRVEQVLCRKLMSEDKARFYWDFDHYYINKHEAGHFIGIYLQEFPNEFPADSPFYNQLRQPKNITYISAPTENIQARYISTWLRENNRIAADRQTAIVLCNEGLLGTAVHCLPEEVKQINVTTGYPLSQTPISSLISLLFSGNRRSLRRHPYYDYIKDVEKNQDITLCQYVMTCVKQVATSINPHGDPLTEEAIFRAYTLLNRINGLVISGDLIVDNTTFQRLIGQLMQTTSIPFHGEPAVGIQMMGVLETRNLDFNHLLVLSCNEGNMPKGINDSSFIPYSIRKAYGLTTIDHKVAIYAYYFHRLLQRATDITMVYNNSTEDGRTGEMSRFMLQLMVEGGKHIERKALQAGQTTAIFHPEAIQKNSNVMQIIERIRFVSPTALNRYLRCQLQYYYYHVAGIKEPDENEENEIDNRIFGNIFHLASEHIYQKLMQKSDTIQRGDLEYLLKHDEQIAMTVDRCMAQELFRLDEGQPLPPLNGLQIINREVIIAYLRQLLRIDSQLTPFTILGLELPVKKRITVDNRSIEIGGNIDRLDLVNIGKENEHIRVVDYKTGSKPSRKVDTLEEVLNAEKIREKHTDYYLQAMLYALIVDGDSATNPNSLPVSPALLFIQHSHAEDYDPTLVIGQERLNSTDTYREALTERINSLLIDIFNPKIPFAPTTDKSICQSCPYRYLCGI